MEEVPVLPVSRWEDTEKAGDYRLSRGDQCVPSAPSHTSGQSLHTTTKAGFHHRPKPTLLGPWKFPKVEAEESRTQTFSTKCPTFQEQEQTNTTQKKPLTPLQSCWMVFFLPHASCAWLPQRCSRSLTTLRYRKVPGPQT